MKSLILLLFVIPLAACSGMGGSNFAQALHGDRVAKESDSTLCLRYLSGGRHLSNQVREVEIQRRGLNCASVVTPRDVEIERRLRAAEDAAEEAENAARRANSAASQAQDRTRRLELCARGLKAYCY